ncbi:MAG: OmpA family protein [Porphyromonadaceae bacterium]|nr:OmpA family protein [Porphyromonadaceae bacterium]
MNTKFTTLALASVFGLATLSAQENTQTTQAAHKTIFAKDAGCDHMFIEIGNLATINYGGHNDKLAWKDRINYLTPKIAIGKWYNPYFATRIQFMGGEMKDYGTQYPTLNPNLYVGYHQFAVGQFDAMLDLVNYFSTYKENRFFHIIPFAGMGVGYNWSSTVENKSRMHHRWTATAHVGLQLKMRLSKRVDLNLESQLMTHDFRMPSYRTADGALFGRTTSALGASLTFHLGKKEFTPVEKEAPAYLKSLNDQLNALRAENAELSKRPVDCPDPMPILKEGVSVGNVVYFRLNSDKVDANQMINIHHIAQYALNNSDVITLVGYADRQTGTPEYNYKLSERRAKSVAKILTEKYGISADRIKISWEGDRKQPYAENVWNRVVIMNADR